jgi:hypothetical protein
MRAAAKCPGTQANTNEAGNAGHGKAEEDYRDVNEWRLHVRRPHQSCCHPNNEGNTERADLEAHLAKAIPRRPCERIFFRSPILLEYLVAKPLLLFAQAAVILHCVCPATRIADPGE